MKKIILLLALPLLIPVLLLSSAKFINITINEPNLSLISLINKQKF